MAHYLDLTKAHSEAAFQEYWMSAGRRWNSFCPYDSTGLMPLPGIAVVVPDPVKGTQNRG